MWDFVTDKSGARAGFLRELQFPLPIYIPSASPQSSSLSPEAGIIGQSGCSTNSLTNQIKIIWLNLMISFQFSIFLSVTQDPNQLAVAP
jgi:hypothetical protein